LATLAQLQEDLAAARASRLRILNAQEISSGSGGSNRRVRHAELVEVNALIKDLEAQIAAQGGGSAGPRRVFAVRNCR